MHNHSFIWNYQCNARNFFFMSVHVCNSSGKQSKYLLHTNIVTYIEIPVIYAQSFPIQHITQTFSTISLYDSLTSIQFYKIVHVSCQLTNRVIQTYMCEEKKDVNSKIHFFFLNYYISIRCMLYLSILAKC